VTSALLALVRATPEADPAILDAAEAAFLDYGIRRTSMGEVAKRAGISPATLYRRFAQKNDLVLAVGLREVRRFIAAVDASVAAADGAEEQLVTMFVAFSQGLLGHQLFHRLLDTEPETMLPLLTVHGAPVLALGTEYVAGHLRRLQERGELPDYDVTPIAEAVARVALSLALTPQTSIPLEGRGAEVFAREYVSYVCRLPR